MDPTNKHTIHKKMVILQLMKATKNVAKTCEAMGIARATFYRWKVNYEKFGRVGLISRKRNPIYSLMRIEKDVELKIIQLRNDHDFGPDRISMYLKRYYDISVSSSGVYRILRRNHINRLRKNARKRSPGPSYKMYEKKIPGHHVQMDVKILCFEANGKRNRRFQYTAIDDTTRIRVLKIFPKHTQKNAIKFVDHVIESVPFRIKMVRTDNGHEFQAGFHWHVKDLGIDHVYIKPGTPRLNGKVERSHRTDEEEFYQNLEYTGDVDLKEKLDSWEKFYNFHRPHMSLDGATPYEVLKKKIGNKSTTKVSQLP